MKIVSKRGLKKNAEVDVELHDGVQPVPTPDEEDTLPVFYADESPFDDEWVTKGAEGLG